MYIRDWRGDLFSGQCTSDSGGQIGLSVNVHPTLADKSVYRSMYIRHWRTNRFSGQCASDTGGQIGLPVNVHPTLADKSVPSRKTAPKSHTTELSADLTPHKN